MNQIIYDLYVDSDGDMALAVAGAATYVYCQDRGRPDAAEDHYIALEDFHDHWDNAAEQDDLWLLEDMYYSHQTYKKFSGTLEQCYNVIDKVKGYL